MPATSELGGRHVDQEPMPLRYAIVIPGQGGMDVGAGKEDYDTSPEAREVFDYADSYLASDIGGSLKSLIFNGPEEELSLTENSHLALTTISYAKFRKLSTRDGYVKPTAIAPQSASECAALAIANVVPFDEALEIARARGEFTAEAGRKHPGRMLWVNDVKGGLDVLNEQIEVARGEVLSISNVNADREFIIAGDIGSIARLNESLEDVRKKQLLPISFASHCALMGEAQEKFAEFLDAIHFDAPDIPLVINGAIVVNPDELKKVMSEGLTQPIVWPDTVRTLDRNNVHHMIELTANIDRKPRLTRSTGNISGLSARFTTSAI